MKDVIGYEDKYAVDEDGNVWSKNYRRSGKMGKMKGGTDHGGYRMVVLRKDGKQKSCTVHRLMAEAYLPDFCKGMIVDHIDRDITNNNLSNLRMVTQQQNTFNSKSKGYTFRKDKKTKPWQGQIMKDGKQHHLGFFATEEDARQAYLTAKETMHVI